METEKAQKDALGGFRLRKHALLAAATGALILGGTILLAYQHWGSSGVNPVVELLAQMPSDANTVLYVDVNALRQSAFLAELYKWAPQSVADADYTQFVQATGFNYERDLNRLGIALSNRSQDTVLFAVAEGKFDHKKISAYASQTGTRLSRSGPETFSVPINGGAHPVAFTFLRNDRIALTNGSDLHATPPRTQTDFDAQAWRERFLRLAGSPIFAVIRQDGAAASALPQAPGGFQSPQLAAILDQLQWITIAGKPEADHLRVVVEGEGSPQTNTRQLSDLLNGLLLLAQAGLSDPKVRQQLPPQVREAYLEVLKTADVSQLDRGDTKSVRVMFEVTPNFLEIARSAVPAGPAITPSKPFPNKSTIRN